QLFPTALASLALTKPTPSIALSTNPRGLDRRAPRHRERKDFRKTIHSWPDLKSGSLAPPANDGLLAALSQLGSQGSLVDQRSYMHSSSDNLLFISWIDYSRNLSSSR